MSKSMFQSFQQMCDLNIQLVQTMLEETTLASQQLLTADRPGSTLSAAASRAQPASEKLRAYQQHISRLAADAQVKLAKVAEEHVQTTTRTAQQLANEVARTANEETERGIRTGQETLRQFSDPFAQAGNGPASSASERERAGASLQSGGQGMSQGGSAQGSAQSGSSQSGSSQSGSSQSASAQGGSSGGSAADMQGQSGGGHGYQPGSHTRNP